MFKQISGLRDLAYLKRIAIALEHANELEERRQSFDCPQPPLRTPADRKIQISHPTVDSWNEKARR